MTNLEIIQKLKSSEFKDQDGEIYRLHFEVGLTDAEIDVLKEKFPAKTIDHDLVEILKETRGWSGGGFEPIYFDSIGEFGLLELSAFSLTLGHDGLGNYWILDLDHRGKLGKVYYACHDPAVYVINSQNLNEYLHHLLEDYKQPSKSHIGEIYENVGMDIWEDNNLCCTKSEFQQKNKNFDDFLEQFPGDKWHIADLRNGRNGDGFAWGRYGSNEFTVRHPTELLWVMQSKKKSIFRSIFDLLFPTRLP